MFFLGKSNIFKRVKKQLNKKNISTAYSAAALPPEVMRLFATVFLLAHPVASTFMTNPVDAAGFPLDIAKSVDVTKTCPGTDQGCYSRAVGSSSTLLGLSAASGKRRAFVSIDNTGLDTNSPNGGVAVIDVVSGQVERFFWDMIKPNGTKMDFLDFMFFSL